MINKIKRLFLKNLAEVKKGGIKVFKRKLFRLLKIIKKVPLLTFAIPIVLFCRLFNYFITIRFGILRIDRIGHLGTEPELYLCEKNANINTPKNFHIDIFCMGDKPICNHYLLKKWRKKFFIWPKWLVELILTLFKLIPGSLIHLIPNNTNYDRDVNNLLDKYPSHLSLTEKEEKKGQNLLKEMGIPLKSKFVCLIVRDSAYLNNHLPNGDFNYHNYRDCDINNYLNAAEYLVEQGFYVLRMGRVVNKPFISNKIEIIDYANSKWASDFMDIYLGARCTFCISTGAGWDAVPSFLFRKPTIFTNLVPFGALSTYSDKFLSTTKRHFSKGLNRELSMSEIFENGLGFSFYSNDYALKGVDLIENSPQEILDVVMEMIEYLKGDIFYNEQEEYITKRFWEKYSKLIQVYAPGKNEHGILKARFSISYLSKNQWWIN
jgi:putative glycosyltransferase (TIGR04372 family)